MDRSYCVQCGNLLTFFEEDLYEDWQLCQECWEEGASYLEAQMAAYWDEIDSEEEDDEEEEAGPEAD